ncbi:MAG: threonyl-tRNA synthetase editing domain-containing protein [Candidatus Bathyarchaeia archaeon]
MRLQITHVDYVRWKVTGKVKRIDIRDDIDSLSRQGEVRDALVVFCTVEGVDQRDPDLVLKKACDEMNELAVKRLKVENVVLFPYVHLFPESIPPAKFAFDMLNRLQERLSENFKVFRAPFGWYKMHELKCKGHPLSESSRTVRPD